MPENLELRQIFETQNPTTSRWLNFKLKSCPYLGIILATLSSFFFSLCSVIVKSLVDVNPMELASFRFVGVLLPTIPIVIYTKQTIFPEGKRIILILRCFMGTTGLILSFYAFRHMPLADASVIIFSTPVFVTIFARIFLKEHCGFFNIITIILTLIGVILITRPPFIFGFDSDLATNEDEYYSLVGKQFDIWGPVAAISSTLFGANVYILLRALKNIHYSVIMTNFGAFALLYTLIVCWSLGVVCWPICGKDRFLVITLGLFSFLGQILLTLALKYEQAGPVSIARCSDIVFAFIWQIIFFQEKLSYYSIIGAILVVSSVIITGLKKWSLTLPRDSNTRKRLISFGMN